MAPRRVLLLRALSGVLLAPTLVVSASAGPASAKPASPKGVISVPNGGFEQGTAHWVSARPGVRLSSSSDSWRGSRALKAKAVKKRATLRVRSTSRIRPSTDRGLRWTVRLKPSATRKVMLTVVEKTASGKRKTHTKKVRARANKWTKVRVKLRKVRPASSFRPILRSHRLTRGETILADAVRLRRVSATGKSPDTARSNPDRIAGVLNNGCTYTTRGLPECGTYLGMAYGSNTDPAPLEAKMGSHMGVRRTYYRADQVASAVRTAKNDLAKGRLPWVSFKFAHTWEQMASGKGDAWAASLAKQFAAVDGPVWLAFHHEPEGDGDIKAWRRTQERLAPIIRAGGDNIAYTVILTGWNQLYGPDEYSLANIWPRRVKIDVAGFDVYNFAHTVKDGKVQQGTNLDTTYFAKLQAWAKKQGVAWGLAETGYNDSAHAADPAWISRTLRQLEKRDAVAMAYFNTTLNSITTWRLGEGDKWGSFIDASARSARMPRQ